MVVIEVAATAAGHARPRTLTPVPPDADTEDMRGSEPSMSEREANPSEDTGERPSPIADAVGLDEEGPSLRQAARALYTARHDPDLEVDLQIASSMSGVLWIAGGLLCIVMLALAPPDRALGMPGWPIAALVVVATLAIGVQRLGGSSPSSVGFLFAGSIAALLGVAFLEWIAGGRSTPYHQLYALPVIYAAAVQTRRRALIVFGLVAIVIWAPLLYAPPARQLPADIAGQLLLLVTLAIAGRMVFTLLRAQRTGLRRARAQAHHLARTDSLTGLGNRLRLEETLEVEVARARRQSGTLSLIIGDLDGFKDINDALGHAGGDECLRRVAQAMGEASRTEDQCFRWGGDEFVVVLPDTDRDAADEVRRRVCTAASGACSAPDGGEVRLTCGTAELGRDDTVATLLAKADKVLLRFKRSSERAKTAVSAAAGQGGG